jgi:hypothetical protein
MSFAKKNGTARERHLCRKCHLYWDDALSCMVLEKLCQMRAIWPPWCTKQIATPSEMQLYLGTSEMAA